MIEGKGQFPSNYPLRRERAAMNHLANQRGPHTFHWRFTAPNSRPEFDRRNETCFETPKFWPTMEPPHCGPSPLKSYMQSNKRKFSKTRGSLGLARSLRSTCFLVHASDRRTTAPNQSQSMKAGTSVRAPILQHYFARQTQNTYIFQKHIS